MKKLMVIVAALAMITGSAYAAEWNFYGSARIKTFVLDTDNVGGARDTKNLTHDIQSNSRIGARIKVNDQLKARFEYGSKESANIRHLYAEWNFGAGKFLVGQTDPPLKMVYSNQVYGTDMDLFYYGGIGEKRQPMLRLKFGNFMIAALSPNTPAISGMSDTEARIPKIEAKYKIAKDNWAVTFAGGYNTYEIIGATQTYDIDSYMGAVGAKITFGAAYLKGNLWFGQNTGSYGFYNRPYDDPTITGNTVNDVDAHGYVIVTGYKLNDMFSFEAGYGFTEAELDVAGYHEDDEASYYVQTTITLAPGVFIVPEIGVLDHKQGKDGKDQSEAVYYGAKWQINF